VKQPPQRGLVNIYSRAGEIVEQRTKRGTFLEEFLAGDLMKYSNSTDPRDKIYALLGLMRDSEKNSVLLQPDYSKSVEQVYGEVVRQLLRENEEEAWRHRMVEVYLEGNIITPRSWSMVSHERTGFSPRIWRCVSQGICQDCGNFIKGYL
jgi:hypothetical protein